MQSSNYFADLMTGSEQITEKNLLTFFVLSIY